MYHHAVLIFSSDESISLQNFCTITHCWPSNRTFMKLASVICIFLISHLSPAFAGARIEKLPNLDETPEGLEQTLENNFSPEDRARIRKALADYSKSTDPGHVRIEQRRKSMQDSVQQRFLGCNKDIDDSLDREEATECLPQVARHFNAVDIDENGVITLDELELAQAKAYERQREAEAKIETERLKETEIMIKNKKNKSKQAAGERKRDL